MDELLKRVRNYLGNGGLFNPELMNADKVRELIIDLAAALSSPSAQEPIAEAVLLDLDTRIFYAQTSLTALIESARLFRSKALSSPSAQSSLTPTTECPDGEKHVLRCIRCELPSSAVRASGAPTMKINLDALAALAKTITDVMFADPGIQRLVLTIDEPKHHDVGGWNRFAFERTVYKTLVREAAALSSPSVAESPTRSILVDRDADVRREMRAYLDTLTITSDNIGDIRRSLLTPFDSQWNGWVREDTADRELVATSPSHPSKVETP